MSSVPTRVPARGPIILARALLSAALVGLAMADALAQQSVAIPLQHRSAEAVIAALRPQLAGVAMSAGEGAVFVRATQWQLPQVMQSVRMADQPLRPLQIDLRDEVPSDDAPQAPARPGSTTLSTGRPMPVDGAGNGQVLSTGAALPSGRANNGQLLSTGPTQGAREIREGDVLLLSMPAMQSLWFHRQGASAGATAAASGGSAAGHASTSAPAGAASGTTPAAGVDVAGTVQFEAMTDVNARIWLAGDTVAIQLRPRPAGAIDAAAPASGDVRLVYGRVGQWIALADSGRRIASHGAADTGAPRTGLWIRVAPLP